MLAAPGGQDNRDLTVVGRDSGRDRPRRRVRRTGGGRRFSLRTACGRLLAGQRVIRRGFAGPGDRARLGRSCGAIPRRRARATRRSVGGARRLRADHTSSRRPHGTAPQHEDVDAPTASPARTSTRRQRRPPQRGHSPRELARSRRRGSDRHESSRERWHCR